MLRKVCVITTLVMSLAAAVVAQSRDRGFRRSADASCSDGWNDRRASHCEIREDTIGGANPLDIDAALDQIEFRLAATNDQFSTMAKMRAARLLWARVADVCGGSANASAMRIMIRRYSTTRNGRRTAATICRWISPNATRCRRECN